MTDQENILNFAKRTAGLMPYKSAFHFLLPAVILCPASLIAELTWTERWIVADEIKLGQTELSVAFRYKNTGTSQVKLLGVQPSCECTRSSISKQVVAPGEEGEVSATFNFGNRTGYQKKQILVSTDDPTEAQVLLTLECSIPEAVRVEPADLRWQLYRKPSAIEATLTIQDGVQMEILSIHSTNDNFHGQLLTVQKGKKYIVTVRPESTAEETKSTLRLLTSSSKIPEVHLDLAILREEAFLQ